MRSSVFLQVPAGVPVLQRGRHRSPEQGGCFMEIASLLGGEQWSDHPRCTDRLLATIARGVNDRLGEETRQQLMPWIPQVVGANQRHPMLTAAIMTTLVEHARQWPSDERSLRWAAKHADRRQRAWERGWWHRMWLWVSDPVFRVCGDQRQVVRASLNAIDAGGGEDALITVLTSVISSFHHTVAGLGCSTDGESTHRAQAASAAGRT